MPFPTVPPRENVISGGRLDNERKFSPARFSFVSLYADLFFKNQLSPPFLASSLLAVQTIFKSFVFLLLRRILVIELKGGGTRSPIFPKNEKVDFSLPSTRFQKRKVGPRERIEPPPICPPKSATTTSSLSTVPPQQTRGAFFGKISFRR